MSVAKIGWSGGKDSTCATYKRIENGDKVKAVCYVPYFTDDIPLINKEHFEFILRQKEIFEKNGCKGFSCKGNNILGLLLVEVKKRYIQRASQRLSLCELLRFSQR